MPETPMPKSLAQITDTLQDVCVMERVSEPYVLVLFGASGDLAARKVLPALFGLYVRRLLPESFLIVGVARTPYTESSFREKTGEALNAGTLSGSLKADWESFARHLYYVPVEYGSHDSMRALDERLRELEERYGLLRNRIFYLALPPPLYEEVTESLGRAGMARTEQGPARIIFEKPFGDSLDTARRLTRSIQRYFDEPQIFRIDHYLGKETVQNILMFRFANAIYEPLWNRQYIDHVQITASESIGVEHRAGYYDHAGVIRDMFQNHMLQLLALVAMEPPARFEAEAVRDEKSKVFRSARPLDPGKLKERWVTGQYVRGTVNGTEVPGYREEKNVPASSLTPTYAAGVFYVDNWRWNGVPFYLRSGKRLARGVTEIVVQFRSAPHRMFDTVMSEAAGPNELVFRIKPDEGIMQRFYTKVPGSRLCLQQVRMVFSYQGLKGAPLDGYQRVLLDCMTGDRMLFVRQDGVELAWEILDPVIKALSETGFPEAYVSGTEGPEGADELLGRSGRRWRSLLED